MCHTPTKLVSARPQIRMSPSTAVAPFQQDAVLKGSLISLPWRRVLHQPCQAPMGAFRQSEAKRGSRFASFSFANVGYETDKRLYRGKIRLATVLSAKSLNSLQPTRGPLADQFFIMCRKTVPCEGAALARSAARGEGLS